MERAVYEAWEQVKMSPDVPRERRKYNRTVPTSLQLEVPTAVLMKGTVICDITPCSPLKVNRRFGGTSP
jgi:hypothetical protein